MAETRHISVAPSFAYHIITAQAGTLSKAVLECIMNSKDAGATEVRIDIDTKGLVVTDNGRGFATREEILEVFEVLGFEHPEVDERRVYGKWGVGRAQLWSFASTLWESNGFQMDVDIKRRGLDYDLREGCARFDGVRITGTFYEPMLTSELLAFQRDLTDLALYAPITVLLNGKSITRDAEREKWTHETDDCWIRLSPHGNLGVYNRGVLVRWYDARDLGTGGVVVTKPGVRLEVNVARNDILVSKCKAWARIKLFIQKQTDARIAEKKSRMTEGELENLARRFLAGELSHADVADVRLITDIGNRTHTLQGFICHRMLYGRVPVTVAERGSSLGEAAHSRSMAFVLSPATLARFGVDSVTGLHDALANVVDVSGPGPFWMHRLSELRFENDFATAVPDLSQDLTVLAEKDWTKDERALIRTLTYTANKLLSRGLVKEGVIAKDSANRQLGVGLSDSALAWTDGCRRITLSRRLLREGRAGLAGIAVLVNILLHEYLHDSADAGAHEHDMAFMGTYHDLTSDPGSFVAEAIGKTFAFHVAYLQSEGMNLSAASLRDIDAVDRQEALTREGGVVAPDALAA